MHISFCGFGKSKKAQELWDRFIWQFYEWHGKKGMHESLKKN